MIVMEKCASSSTKWTSATWDILRALPKTNMAKRRKRSNCFQQVLTPLSFNLSSPLFTICIAEPPVFTKRFEETTVMTRNHLRLECTFEGTPEPTVKWFKDFQPLHDTSRISIMNSSGQSCLMISDVMMSDIGLYSCTATNLAGSTTTAAFVHVNGMNQSNLC